MKRQWISAMAAAATLTLAACDGATSPTEPVLREPTPTPPANILVGAWHGTMSYRGGSCAPEEVDATVTAEGTGVRLNLRSICHGNVVFRLEPQSPTVSGNAQVVYDGICTGIFGAGNHPRLTAQVSGTLDAGSLRLETTSFTMPLVYCTRPGVRLELVR